MNSERVHDRGVIDVELAAKPINPVEQVEQSEQYDGDDPIGKICGWDVRSGERLMC